MASTVENGVVQQFRAPDLIKKKRDGNSLTKEELHWFISQAIKGEVDGYQLGAMLMGIYLQGMEVEETVNLTDIFINSGEVFSWPKEWGPVIADKHSTGGVGDKVSLPLAPALAACGLKIPMVSGRGLSFTGGTLDKLESIPGFNVSCQWQQIQQLVESVGCCIVGQTEALVPADKLLYSVRDVTATVESPPLIAASIISKKAAERLSYLVLDTKYGRGAFNKTYKAASDLAQTLVSVSEGVGVRTRAVLTRMDDPIGMCVGNSLEVWESLQCLRGAGPADLQLLVTRLGGELLQMSGLTADAASGTARVLAALQDGSALEHFCRMLKGQGVSSEVAEALCNNQGSSEDHEKAIWKILPRAEHQQLLRAPAAGYVCGIHALKVAEVCGALGAGRVKAGETIDSAVGLRLLVAVGDWVEKDAPWVEVHYNAVHLSPALLSRLHEALELDNQPVSEERKQRISGVVG